MIRRRRAVVLEWRAPVRRVVARRQVAELLEAAGLHTLADHADRLRSNQEIAAITLPSGRHSLRRQRIKLLRRGGSDQATKAMADGGWRGYEAPLPDVLLGAVRRFPGAFFDVGANTGLYGLVAAAARRGVTVHAFEALPAVASMLEENVAINRTRARFRINRVAVADTSGRAVLHVPIPTGGAVETSASLDAEFKGGGGTAIEVEITSLDAYWSAAGRPDVGVVKIDTEGTEHRVLAGAGQMVAERRPVVFYEFLHRGAGGDLDDWAAAHSMVDVRLSHVEAVIGDRVRYHDLAWNHAFVPAEKVDAFVPILEAARLIVTRLR